MTNPICVDLSHYNPTPDWGQLLAAGTLGVILKATQGTTYTDPTFEARTSAAKAAGLKVSSYHFLQHGNVDQQMAYYLGVIDPEVGDRVVIDYEDTACTLDDLHAAVAYLQAFGLDLQVTVYSGSLIKQQLGSTKDLALVDTALWLAQYTTGAPSWPTGTWPAWSLWQYTDAATVTGISAPVDGNKFNGTSDNFLKWMGPVPPPAPAPSQLDDVMINVTTKPGASISLWVNGLPWMENDR